MGNYNYVIQACFLLSLFIFTVDHIVKIDGRKHPVYLLGIAGMSSVALGKFLYCLISLGIPIPLKTTWDLDAKLDTLLSFSLLCIILELRRGFGDYWEGKERRKLSGKIPLLFKMKGLR